MVPDLRSWQTEPSEAGKLGSLPRGDKYGGTLDEVNPLVSRPQDSTRPREHVKRSRLQLYKVTRPVRGALHSPARVRPPPRAPLGRLAGSAAAAGSSSRGGMTTPSSPGGGE
eukprot:scaffold99057_cov66-Phaeocystis_antarctica.AAC.3